MQSLIDEAYAMFSNDRFAVDICGAKIKEITDDQVTCTMEITPKHLNAAGTVMGGAIFTLADFTFAVAANFHKKLTVSLDSSICYLGTAKGTELIASSRCIKEGKTTCFYDIYISDDLGTPVAKVSMTGYILDSKK